MLRECPHISTKNRISWRKAMAYFEGDLRLLATPEKERDDLYIIFF